MKPIEEWLTQPDGLAVRLRALRMQADLSGKDLAAKTGWATSKVSRLENGRQLPSRDDIRAWARICGADTAVTDELLELLSEAHGVHLDWRRRLRAGQQRTQATYTQLVEQAEFVRQFNTIYVPSLLQTPEYVRRILTESAAMHGAPTDDLDAAVTERLSRQQYLYVSGKRFEFILTESVLRLLLVPPEAMRSQLDRLHTAIGLPNVRFGIIPFGVVLPVTPQNSFQIYGDVTVVETFVGEAQNTPEQEARYTEVMNALWDEAVEGDAARRLITQAAETLG